MIETFTKDQFEKSLPVHKETGVPLWDHLGLIQGEHTYFIKIDNSVGIEIRSSIDKTGISATLGQDSIRAWLVDSGRNPLGSKVSKYTTRRPGWQERTKEVLRTLWKWRKMAGNCEVCGEPNKIFKVKKEGPNKNRVFCKCNNCDKSKFIWLS